MTYRVEDGWRKVAERGSSYVTATLYNIVSGESVSVCVRDWDRWDVSECDAPGWYDVAIDEDARHAWRRINGLISPGDRAMVIKGRKIEPGYVGLVDRIRKVNDRYGRWVADYVVFEDGSATNVTNCVLVMD